MRRDGWAAVADEAAFDRLLRQTRGPLAVAFETSDCRHCREHRALLALAWRHLGWALTTARVDATRVPALATRYRIVGYPTVTVFCAGKLVHRLPGRRPAAAATAHLAQLLSGDDTGCCA
jgi:thioredoxin-like negative regulator of GroEL